MSKTILGIVYGGGGSGSYSSYYFDTGGYNGSDGVGNYDSLIGEKPGSAAGGGVEGKPGVANTGGGGCGCPGYGAGSHPGSSGGSGIIIIKGRYS